MSKVLQCPSTTDREGAVDMAFRSASRRKYQRTAHMVVHKITSLCKYSYKGCIENVRLSGQQL